MENHVHNTLHIYSKIYHNINLQCSVHYYFSFDCLSSVFYSIFSDRTIILPAVLYGCETWSLILREERRLRVFGNRVVRRIFGPKRDEVTEK